MEAERELLTISTTIHQRSWYCLLDDICETPAFDNMGWNDIQFEEIYNRDGILKTAERFHPLFEKSCVLNVDLTGKVVGIALNDSFVHKSLFLLIKFEPKIHAHSVRVGKILAQKCGLHEKSIDPSLDIASFSFISLHSSSYSSSVTLITSRGQLLFITRCGQLMQFMPVHSSSSTAASTPEDKITQVWQLPILDCVRRHAEKEHGTFFERLLTPSITADQQIFRVAVRVGKQSSGSTPLSNKSDNRLVKLLCSDGFVVTELHFTTNENELVHPMKNDVADNVSDVKKNLYLLTQQLSFALTSPFDTSPADLELVNIINTYLRDVANLTSVCTFTECLDQICIQFMYTTDPAKLGTLFPLMTFKLLRTFCDDRNLVFAFHLVSNVGDWLNRFTELRPELYPKSNFSRTPNRKGVKERIKWELGWMYLYSRFHRQLSANNTRKSKEWNDLIKSVMTKVEAIGVEKGYLKTFNDELMKAHIHYITCFESRPDALSIEATALYKSHIIQHKSATALPCLLSGLIQHYDLDFILSFIRYLVGVDDTENFVQWFPHLNFTQLYLNSTNNPWNWLDPCVITNCSMGPSETESTAVESRRSLDDVRELVLDFWKELIALNSSSASRSFEQSESRIRIPSPIDLALLVYLSLKLSSLGLSRWGLFKKRWIGWRSGGIG
ncbi:hypothetical protein BKA69DRAFT_1054532 [Paraphysoderma sedebokerense]|nr:hypothetical protein BKA69DRAFT_1054532 [Paraphysoderma sedebokerense]